MKFLSWLFGPAKAPETPTAPDLVEDAISEVERLERMDSESLRELDADLTVTVEEARAKRKQIATILRAREVF